MSQVIATMSAGEHGIQLSYHPHSFQKWVTHQFNTNVETHTPGLYWGHYFHDMNDALKDFAERVTTVVREAGRQFSAELEENDAALR